MADREYVITFDGDRARVALAAKRKTESIIDGVTGPQPPYKNGDRYHVLAPTPSRAEQIARAMRGGKK